MQGGRDLSSVAGDISSAGAALAGLILVFLGHTAGTFENYGPSERKKVKDRLRKRAVLAFGGFVFALLACLLALIGEWKSQGTTLKSEPKAKASLALDRRCRAAKRKPRPRWIDRASVPKG